MIQVIQGFPENVVGLLAKGEVTRKDYLEVVIPAVEKAPKRNAKLRLYYELGSEIYGIDIGAEWEDFKIGFEHLARWERVAVVTDVAWIRHAVGVFKFLMPGELRVFTTGLRVKAPRIGSSRQSPDADRGLKGEAMTPDDYIPNQWYPIFDSGKLKRRKPVGITRLGERLVLWRDSRRRRRVHERPLPASRRAIEPRMDLATIAWYAHSMDCASIPPADVC